MKKYSNYIIIALIVINIFSILKINNLENSMDNYYQQIMSGINRNNSEISNIYSNINSVLEKQSSSIVYDINGSTLREDEMNISEFSNERHATNFINTDIIDEVELNANEVLTVYANIQDEYGINYKYVVLRNEVDSNGEPVFGRPEWSNGSIVEITRNGKVLNVPNYEY